MVAIATTVITRNSPIIPFPSRGPFSVRIEREGLAWLVICRNYGWAYGSQHEALADAQEIAGGFGVAIVEAS
jgi:hypothetical protein